MRLAFQITRYSSFTLNVTSLFTERTIWKHLLTFAIKWFVTQVRETVSLKHQRNLYLLQTRNFQYWLKILRRFLPGSHVCPNSHLERGRKSIGCLTRQTEASQTWWWNEHPCALWWWGRLTDSFIPYLQEVDPSRNMDKRLGLTSYFCPVTLHDYGILRAGDPEVGVIHQGQVYYFVSEEARARFIQKPESVLQDAERPIRVCFPFVYTAPQLTTWLGEATSLWWSVCTFVFYRITHDFIDGDRRHFCLE